MTCGLGELILQKLEGARTLYQISVMIEASDVEPRKCSQKFESEIGVTV